MRRINVSLRAQTTKNTWVNEHNTWNESSSSSSVALINFEPTKYPKRYRVQYIGKSIKMLCQNNSRQRQAFDDAYETVCSVYGIHCEKQAFAGFTHINNTQTHSQDQIKKDSVWLCSNQISGGAKRELRVYVVVDEEKESQSTAHFWLVDWRALGMVHTEKKKQVA